MSVIWISLIILAGVGLVTSVVLFVVSKFFVVEQDPRIGQIEKLLPGANCGGCGFPGCSAFAAAAVEKGSLQGMACNACSSEKLSAIAAVLGKEAVPVEPKVAVLRCNGTCSNRPAVAVYQGVRRCSVANIAGAGESMCSYGCFGFGDCAAACKFGAVTICPETGIATIDPCKCTGCGACATACPRGIISLMPKTKPDKRYWVACSNKEKGAIAKRSCAVACIGCGKCEKVCSFGAISVTDNLALIDPAKCFQCGKCLDECPTKAIQRYDIQDV